MINCATTYNLTYAIRTVSKWEVKRVLDFDEITPQYAAVEVAVYSTGNVKWPAGFVLSIRNTGLSRVLRVSASPTSFNDEVALTDVQLSGTPYTSIVTAYDANTASGTKAQRRKAVEDILVSLGAMPSEFAGT